MTECYTVAHAVIGGVEYRYWAEQRQKDRGQPWTFTPQRYWDEYGVWLSATVRRDPEDDWDTSEADVVSVTAEADGQYRVSVNHVPTLWTTDAHSTLAKAMTFWERFCQDAHHDADLHEPNRTDNEVTRAMRETLSTAVRSYALKPPYHSFNSHPA